MAIAPDGAGSSLELAQRRTVGGQITQNVTGGNQAAAGATFVDAQQQAYQQGSGGVTYGDPNTTRQGRIVGPTVSPGPTAAEIRQMEEYNRRRQAEQSFISKLDTRAAMTPTVNQGQGMAGRSQTTTRTAGGLGAAAQTAAADIQARAFAQNLSQGFREFGEANGWSPDADGSYDYVGSVYPTYSQFADTIEPQGRTYYGNPDGSTFYVPGRIADGTQLVDADGNKITATGGVFYTADQLRDRLLTELSEPYMVYGSETVNLARIREDAFNNRMAEYEAAARTPGAVVGGFDVPMPDPSYIAAQVEEEVLAHVRTHPEDFPRTARRLQVESDIARARMKVVDAALGGYTNPFGFDPSQQLFALYQRTYNSIPPEMRDDLRRELGLTFSEEDASHVMLDFLGTVVGDQQLYRAGEMGNVTLDEEYEFRGLMTARGNIIQSRRISDEDYEQVALIIEDMPHKPSTFIDYARHPLVLGTIASLGLAPLVGVGATALFGIRLATGAGLSARIAGYFFARGAQQAAVYGLPVRAATAAVGAGLGALGFELAGEDPRLGAVAGGVIGFAAAPVLVSRVAPFLMQGFAAHSHSGRLAFYDSLQGYVGTSAMLESGFAMSDAAQAGLLTGEPFLSSQDTPLTDLVNLPARYLSNTLVSAGVPRGSANWIAMGLEALFWFTPSVAFEGAARFAARGAMALTREGGEVYVRAVAMMGPHMAQSIHSDPLKFDRFTSRIMEGLRIGMSRDEAAIYALDPEQMIDVQLIDDKELARRLRAEGYEGKLAAGDVVGRYSGSDEAVISEALGDYFQFRGWSRERFGAAYEAQLESVRSMSHVDPETRAALERVTVEKILKAVTDSPSAERVGNLPDEMLENLKFRAVEISSAAHARAGEGWADPLKPGDAEGLRQEMQLLPSRAGRLAQAREVPVAAELDEFGQLREAPMAESLPQEQWSSKGSGRWVPETMGPTGTRLDIVSDVKTKQDVVVHRMDGGQSVHWRPENFAEREQIVRVLNIAGYDSQDEAVNGMVQFLLSREMGVMFDDPDGLLAVSETLRDPRWRRLATDVRMWLRAEAQLRIEGGLASGSSREDLYRGAQEVWANLKRAKGRRHDEMMAELVHARLVDASSVEARTREVIDRDRERVLEGLRRMGFKGGGLGEVVGQAGGVRGERNLLGDEVYAEGDFDVDVLIEDAALALASNQLRSRSLRLDRRFRIARRPSPTIASEMETMIARLYFDIRGTDGLGPEQLRRLAAYADGRVPVEEAPLLGHDLDNQVYTERLVEAGYEAEDGQVQVMFEYRQMLATGEKSPGLQKLLADDEMRVVLETRYATWNRGHMGALVREWEESVGRVDRRSRKDPMVAIADEHDAEDLGSAVTVPGHGRIRDSDVLRDVYQEGMVGAGAQLEAAQVKLGRLRARKRPPKAEIRRQEEEVARQELQQTLHGSFESEQEVIASLVVWKRPFETVEEEIVELEAYVRKLERLVESGELGVVPGTYRPTLEAHRARIAKLRQAQADGTAEIVRAQDPARLDPRLSKYRPEMPDASELADLRHATDAERGELVTLGNELERLRATLKLYQGQAETSPDEMRALLGQIGQHEQRLRGILESVATRGYDEWAAKLPADARLKMARWDALLRVADRAWDRNPSPAFWADVLHRAELRRAGLLQPRPLPTDSPVRSLEPWEVAYRKNLSPAELDARANDPTVPRRDVRGREIRAEEGSPEAVRQQSGAMRQKHIENARETAQQARARALQEVGLTEADLDDAMHGRGPRVYEARTTVTEEANFYDVVGVADPAWVALVKTKLRQLQKRHPAVYRDVVAQWTEARDARAATQTALGRAPNHPDKVVTDLQAAHGEAVEAGQVERAAAIEQRVSNIRAAQAGVLAEAVPTAPRGEVVRRDLHGGAVEGAGEPPQPQGPASASPASPQASVAAPAAPPASSPVSPGTVPPSGGGSGASGAPPAGGGPSGPPPGGGAGGSPPRQPGPPPGPSGQQPPPLTDFERWAQDYLGAGKGVVGRIPAHYDYWLGVKAGTSWSGKLYGVGDILAPVERYRGDLGATVRGAIEAENSLVGAQGYMMRELELQARRILDGVDDWVDVEFVDPARLADVAQLKVDGTANVVDDMGRVYLGVVIEHPDWFNLAARPSLDGKLRELRQWWEVVYRLDRMFDLDYNRAAGEGGYLTHFWDGEFGHGPQVGVGGKPMWMHRREFGDIVEGLKAGRRLQKADVRWVLERALFSRSLARARRQTELKLQELHGAGHFSKQARPNDAVETVLRLLKENDGSVRQDAFAANISHVMAAIRSVVYGLDASFWVGTQGVRALGVGPADFMFSVQRGGRAVVSDPYFAEHMALNRDLALDYSLAGGSLFSNILERPTARADVATGFLTDNVIHDFTDRAVGRSSAVMKLQLFRTLRDMTAHAAHSRGVRRALYALGPWNWETMWRHGNFSAADRDRGMVAFIDNLLGGKRVSAMPGSQAMAEAIIAATPNFLRSTLALVGAMGRRDFEGVIARRYALQFMAIATAGIAMLNGAMLLTRGKFEWNPIKLVGVDPTDEDDFMVVETPWGRLKPFAGVTNTMATLIRSVYNPEGGMVGPFFDPDEWLPWLQSRFSNPVGLGAQLASGNEWFAPNSDLWRGGTEDAFIRSVSMAARKSMPITLGGILESVEHSVLDGQALNARDMIFGGILDFVGFGQASSYVSLADAQERWAMDEFGMGWDELLRFQDGEARQDMFYDSEAFADWEQQGEKFGDEENPGFVEEGSEDTEGRREFLQWVLESGQVDRDSVQGREFINELAEIRDNEIRGKIEAGEPLVDEDGRPYNPTDVLSARQDIARDFAEIQARMIATANGIALPEELSPAVLYAVPGAGGVLRAAVDETARMAVYQGVATDYQAALVTFLDAVAAKNRGDWRSMDTWQQKQMLHTYDDLQRLYDEMGRTAELGDLNKIAQTVYERSLDELTVQERREVEAIAGESDRFFTALDEVAEELDGAISRALADPELVGPQVGEQLDEIRAQASADIQAIYAQYPELAAEFDAINGLRLLSGDRGAMYRQFVTDTKFRPFVDNDVTTQEGLEAALQQQAEAERMYEFALGETHPGLYNQFVDYSNAGKSDWEQTEGYARDFVTNHPLNPLEAEDRVVASGAFADTIRARPAAARLMEMMGIDIAGLRGLDHLRAELISKLRLLDLSKDQLGYYGEAGVQIYRLIQTAGDDGNVYERGDLLQLVTDEKNRALDSDTKLDVLFNYFYSYDDLDVSPRNENANVLTQQLGELMGMARLSGAPDIEANREAALLGQPTSASRFQEGLDLIFTQGVAPRPKKGFEGPPSPKQTALLNELGLDVPATMGEAAAILDGYFQQNPRGSGGFGGADAPWRSEPVSDSQRAVLEDLGLEVPATKGEASDILDREFGSDGGGGGGGGGEAESSADWREEPASAAQLNLAKDLGLSVPQGATKGQLSDMLDKALSSDRGGGGGGGSSSRFGPVSEAERIIMNTGMGLYANREGIKSLPGPPEQAVDARPDALVRQLRAHQAFRAAGMSEQEAAKALGALMGIDLRGKGDAAVEREWDAAVSAVIEQWSRDKAQVAAGGTALMR